MQVWITIAIFNKFVIKGRDLDSLQVQPIGEIYLKVLDREYLRYKSKERIHYDWDEYDVDQNISLILVESAVLDVEVLEGEARVRELEDVWLRCDNMIEIVFTPLLVDIFFVIQALRCVFSNELFLG